MPTLVLAKLDPGSNSSLGNIAGGWGQGGGQGARVGGRNYLVLSLHRGRGLGARASGPCLLGLAPVGANVRKQLARTVTIVHEKIFIA